MRPLLVNIWGIVAPQGTHVITATLTILPVGIVTIVVVIVATVTRTVIIMVETEIGAIVEVPLLLVAVDIPLTIGAAGATLVAHRLEEAALHLVPEGAVVAQETTTLQLLQQALLLLQLLPLNMRGGKDLTPSTLADSTMSCLSLDWLRCIICGMWFPCLLRSIYLFLVLLSCLLFLIFSPFILSDRFFICPVAVAVDGVVIVMGLQDVQVKREKKVFYNQIIMKNKGE